MVTIDQSRGELTEFSQRFLSTANKNLYRHNTFRQLQIPTFSTIQQINKRKNMVVLAGESGMPFPKGTFAYFQRGVSNNGTLNQAVEGLYDPLVRLLNEFFWIWPDEHTGVTPANEEDWIQYWHLCEQKNHFIAIHNLAVLYQAAAIELEEKNLETPLSPNVLKKLDVFWQEALKRWARLCSMEEVWDFVSQRIAEIDDPQLPRIISRRIREALPSFLLVILVNYQAEHLKKRANSDSDRIYGVLRNSGFPSEQTEFAAKFVAGPLREQVRSSMRLAKQELESTQQRDPKPIEERIQQLSADISSLSSLMRGNSGELAGIREEYAYVVIDLANKYLKDTDDWSKALTWLEKTRSLVGQGTAYNKLSEAITSISDKGANGFFWRGPGYYQLQKKQLDLLETAKAKLDKGEYNIAISTLRTEWESRPADQSAWNTCLCYALSFAYYSRSGSYFQQATDLAGTSTQVWQTLEDRVDSWHRSPDWGRQEYARITGYNGYGQKYCTSCSNRINEGYYTFEVLEIKVPVCNSCQSRHVRESQQQQKAMEQYLGNASNDLYWAQDINPRAKYLKECHSGIREIAKKIGIILPSRPKKIEQPKPSSQPTSTSNSANRSTSPSASASRTAPVTSSASATRGSPSQSVQLQSGGTSSQKAQAAVDHVRKSLGQVEDGSSKDIEEVIERPGRDLLVILAIVVGILLLIGMCKPLAGTYTTNYSPSPTRRTVTQIVSPTPIALVITSSVPQLSPTIEPSNIPLPIASGCVDHNLNVRSGPGTDYPIIGLLTTGKCGQVTGRNQDGSWFVVQTDFQGTPIAGWASAEFMELEFQQEGRAIQDLEVVD